MDKQLGFRELEKIEDSIKKVLQQNMGKDEKEREFKEHIARFERHENIPFYLTKKGFNELIMDLGNDRQFCERVHIPFHKFDEYMADIKLALCRIYF